MAMSNFPNDLGIILVDHGSKRAEANALLDEVAKLFREQSGARIVEAAHMELAPPTIADALAACVAQGAKRVVVHPYFLAPGRHSTSDIPRMCAEAAAAHPDIDVRVSEPLGLDERLIAVVEARVRAALDA